MYTRRSVINQKNEISPESWIVYLLNIVDGITGPYLPDNGHSVIVVEGIKKIYTGGYFSRYQDIVRRYEIDNVISREKPHRLWLLSEGASCEMIPQDVVVLKKQGLRITAQWKKYHQKTVGETGAEEDLENLSYTLIKDEQELLSNDTLLQWFPEGKENFFEINRYPITVPGRLLLCKTENENCDLPDERTLLLRLTKSSFFISQKKSGHIITKPIVLKDEITQFIYSLDIKENPQELDWRQPQHQLIMNDIFAYCFNIYTNKNEVDRMAELFNCQLLVPNIQDHAFINQKRFISKIGMYKDLEIEEVKKLFHYSSRHWPASPSKVRDMKVAIKNDAAHCERAQRGECEYLPYQVVGTQHFLTEEKEGHNCTSWCIEKLKIIGADLRHAKSKPKTSTKSDINPLSRCVLL